MRTIHAWNRAGLWAAAAALCLTAPVLADGGVAVQVGVGRHTAHGGFDLRLGFGMRDEHRPVYAPRLERVWVEPVYRVVYDRVWVEPVYRTVVERVWREPVANTVYEQVWVPERFEERLVFTGPPWHRVAVRVCMLVEPGHYETRSRQVVMGPGCWTTVERRELVCAGYWQTVERRELVMPGRYELRHCGWPGY